MNEEWTNPAPADEPLPPVVPEPLLPAETAADEAPTQFEPDFGTSFDDYGDLAAQLAPAPSVRRRRRHLKKMHVPTLFKVAIYLAIVVAVGVLLGNYAWKFLDDAAALTRPDETVEVVINENDDLDAIAATLKEVGAIEYEWLFKLYCKFTGSENYFDPGVYTINLTYDYHALTNYLQASAGARETVTLMIIEGSDCYEIFDLLEKNGVCSRERLEQAAAEYRYDYPFLNYLPYGATNRLEGYLFPDTYQFYLKDEPQNVLGRLLRNFNNRLDEDYLELIDQSGYTMEQIITMASIVEAEAGYDDERAKIASVIFNRLNNWDNPLLGMDSTVYYGAKLLGTKFTTSLDSPYNTYRYAGLPKGPICNPGMASIRAVLYPEKTNYYYFATGVDGHNHFFENEEDFKNFLNSDQYQDIIPEEYKNP